MTQNTPLMPKATAVWLVENTSLSFDQIAEFCGMHLLEVKGIADGEVAQGIRGKDPITAGELSRDEIKDAEADPSHRLKLAVSKVEIPQVKTKRGPRYTPLSRRHDRPNAVLWLLRNHPELKDAQIIRLVGTTKPTIQQIRDRTHWNSATLQPQDPVTLGLCSQIDLDNEVKVASKRLEKERIAAGIPAEPAGTLLPTSETTRYLPGDPQPDIDVPAERPQDEEARMLARLKLMSSRPREDEDEQPEVDMSILTGGATAIRAEPEEEPQPDVASPADAFPLMAVPAPAAAPVADIEAGSQSQHEPEAHDSAPEAEAKPVAKPPTDYLAEVKRHVPDADAEAVAKIVRHLGIALRNTDASLVACSSKDELTRVRESWLRKKLALEVADEELDAAIEAVCETMKADRNKHRVTFYYLLAARFEKLAEL